MDSESGERSEVDNVENVDKVENTENIDDIDDIDNEEIDDGLFGDDDDDDEKEEEAKAEEISKTTISLSRHPVSAHGKALIFNVPRFLSVDAVPFNPNSITLSAENAEEESVAQTNQFKALKTANAVRWRYAKTKEGRVYKQSNASIVEWDDGSLSLRLGNEILDFHSKDCESVVAVRDDSANITMMTPMPITSAVDVRPASMKSQAHRSLANVLSQRARVRGVKTHIPSKPIIKPLSASDDSSDALSAVKRAGADLYR